MKNIHQVVRGGAKAIENEVMSRASVWASRALNLAVKGAAAYYLGPVGAAGASMIMDVD